jgi:hypothetical protein
VTRTAYFPVAIAARDGSLTALRRLMRSRLGDRAKVKQEPTPGFGVSHTGK